MKCETHRSNPLTNYKALFSVRDILSTLTFTALRPARFKLSLDLYVLLENKKTSDCLTRKLLRFEYSKGITPKIHLP